MATATYKHQGLHSPRSTRLIELEPSHSHGAPLRCRLLEISLDNHPPYEALSYSWDAQSPKNQILCFNLNWLITENCDAALRQMRLSDRVRLLWINSICIDQSSIPERNQQIGLMEEIYARAMEVLVWLGKGNKASDAAIRQLVNGSKNPDRTHERMGIHDDSVVRSLMWESFITSIVWCIVRPAMLLCGTPSSKKNRSAISSEGYSGMFFSLFARSVFERMWCVQEVAVAQRVRLVCGGASISWDEMIVALDYLSRLYDVMLESNIMVELYKGRLALQKQLKDIVGSTRFPHNQNPQQWPSLTTLIITTRNRGATDPKDKVFALAGLFKLMGLNLPPPDYAKSVRQVYQEITKAAISQYHSLDILYHVTGFANSFDLPSWVPDLSDTRHPMPLMYPAFSASATSPPYYRFSDTALTLTLWGKSLGPITALGDPVLFYAHAPSQPPPPSPTAEADALLATFKQWSSLAHSLPSYPNGQPIAEAFARTLFTNGIYHDIRGPADFLAVFPTWHALLTSATSSADLSDSGVENMLRDVAAIPAQAVEKREFALSVAAAIFGLGVGTMRGKGKRARLVHAWLGVAMRRKRFFVMGGGFMGVVGGMGEVGDEVVLFAGLRVPFLVGRAEGGEGWRIKGPAYVHGVMEGEGWREGEGLDEFVVV